MINANLKRVFRADLCDDLPEQFVELLNQLEQIDQDNADAPKVDPESDADEA